MKHLFAFYYLLDIIQFIQCFKRGQIIDIQIQNLIPYLTQYRIIQLEEAELHSAPAGRYLSRRLGNALLAVVRFQLMQNIIGTLHDAFRHTCHLAT